MANEPNWEDIVKVDPSTNESARPAPSSQDSQPSRDAQPSHSSQDTQPSQDAQPSHSSPEPYPQTRQFPAADTDEAAPSGQFDPFAELFSGAPAPEHTPTGAFPTAETAVPTSRRELRESEGRRRSASGSGAGGNSGPEGGRGGSGDGRVGTARPAGKRKLLWLKITLPIVLVLGAVGGVAAFGWFNYNEQVRALLGIPLPTDYEGTGNGEEVIVTIVSGDIGADVAATLHSAGVTLTFDAVYDYLVENPDIGFFPGNWSLEKEMSAESAMAALQDPANKVTSQLLVTEGTVLPNALEIIASTTGIPLEEVQAAAADPTVYGVPANAPSLEGYLFPATYELDGSETAQGILQLMVTTMFEHLDSFGVPVEQRHEVLTKASIIQREAGSNPDDFYKVARVFQNRLDQGINLESDATVAYGTGRLDTVWTEPEERADPSNLYNTYANPGLPVGPIGLPGDLAIEAVLSPADGPWLFFVPINLATGETAFSETAEEHQGNVDILLEWCSASPENETYCE